MPSRIWYLFLYQIPPRPLYLRAKIRQRLLKLGAVALKKSAYALPAEERLLEPLRDVARETEAGGGEAYICEARFVDEATDAELVARFAEERGLARRGRVWVAEQNIGIDAMATAWLIRRYIDAKARFRFVEPGTTPKESETPFDTYQAMASQLKIRNKAVKRIGEIVSDITLRAKKYRHAETAGVEQMVAGITRAHPTDEARLERGLVFFDDLASSI